MRRGIVLLGLWIALLAGLRAAGFNAAPLFRDPATMAGAPVWHGALSVLGCMTWALAAAACAGVAILGARPERFWWGAACLLAAMGLDDALMLHEEVLPAAGVPEEGTFAAYAAAFATLAWLARGSGVDIGVRGLGIALCALGASVALDVVASADVIYEDGPKLFGVIAVAAWACTRFAGASRVARSGVDVRKTRAALTDGAYIA
jgi:hypothetical protein